VSGFIKKKMENFKIYRSEFVELFAGPTNALQTIYFPDLPNLRNTRTFGLSAYTVDTLTQGLQGDGLSIVQAKRILVYLYFDNGLFIVQPYLSFANNQSADTTTTQGSYFYTPVQFAGQRITWSKSYVQITDPATVGGYGGHSFIFNVYYTLN
jgi:hypothetical protein